MVGVLAPGPGAPAGCGGDRPIVPPGRRPARGAPACSNGGPGDGLGTSRPTLGTHGFCGEKVWISRTALDLDNAGRTLSTVRVAEARRTPKRSRKVEPEVDPKGSREADRRSDGRPRGCRRRQGAPQRRSVGAEEGARAMAARGTGRWLPWSPPARPGPGLSDTAPVAGGSGSPRAWPRGAGRLRPDGYSGLRSRPGRPATGVAVRDRPVRAGVVHRRRGRPRRRRTARTRARRWCGRCRTGRSTAARTRPPTSWASSSVGWPVSTRWAESARTSLERLQTCRSWTSPTPATAVMAGRRARPGRRRRGWTRAARRRSAADQPDRLRPR